LRLTTGGLRALTGSIGKNDHDAFALDTPVATIGIRGTGTDTSTDGVNLDHSTWQGLSFIHNEAGEFDVPEGSSSSTSGQNGIPQIYPTPPNAPQPPEPRPDTNKADPNKVFETKPPVSGATLVNANTGSATVESNDGENTTTVEENETSSANSNGEITTTEQSDNSTPSDPSSSDSSFDDADNSLEGCTI